MRIRKHINKMRRCKNTSGVNSYRDPILKIPNTKRAGRMAQAVEHLPSKCEALS
jgi:hypothetical protein